MAFALAACGWLMATVTAARAESVRLQATTHKDFGRLEFAWPSAVGFEAAANEGRLVVRFDRPIEADYGPATKTLSRYIGKVEPGADGRSVAFPLAPGVTALSFASRNAVTIDFMHINEPKEPSRDYAKEKAAKPASPLVRLQASERQGSTRLTFTWPKRVGYHIERNGAKAVIAFDRPGRIESRSLDGKAFKYVQDITIEAGGESLKAILTASETSKIVDAQSGSKVVIDVQAPVRDARDDVRPTDRGSPEAAVQVEEKESDAHSPPSGTAASADATPQVPSATMVDGPSQSAPPPTVTTLRFDWQEPVAAAVFRRGNALWTVFDRPSHRDLEALQAAGDSAIRRIEQLPSTRATVLRMTAADGVNPSVRRDGLSWILEFRQQALAAEKAIESTVHPTPEANARLFLTISDPGEPIVVDDPDAGDSLVVVPVIPLGYGLPRDHHYPQMMLLASAQGIVIRPLIDNLRIRSLREGIEVTADGGLRLSSVPDSLRLSAQAGMLARPGRTLDFTGWWSLEDVESFLPYKRTLERAIIDAPAGERESARFELARFLLANAFNAEALGVLRLISGDRPDIENEAKFRALRGVGELLMGRLLEAGQDLLHSSLNGSEEIVLWRTVLSAAKDEFSNDLGDLEKLAAGALTHPKALRMPLIFLLTEAAIEAGEMDQASPLLDWLRFETSAPVAQGRINYLQGRLLERKGEHDGAFDRWQEAERSPSWQYRAKASLAKTELQLRLGRISRREAIDALERLRLTWRGDAFEFRLLRRLGQLHFEEQNYALGLRALREAATRFPTRAEAHDVTHEMASMFEQLFLGGAADALPPIAAIALYDEFRELTPAGDKGNDIIRNLVDRLVQVDLLPRAADLLQHQVQFRLTGIDKAQVGTRLALVYMLDRKPEQVLAALRMSAGMTLPEDLRRERRRLEAEAQASLGRPDQALAVLEGDDGMDADLVRADIFWSNQDWNHAAQALGRAVHATRSRRNTPLSEAEGERVLQLAVALTLAGNTQSLAELRRDFGASMETTRLRDAFRVIADGSAPAGMNAQALLARIREVEQFQAFLASQRERLGHSSRTSIN